MLAKTRARWQKLVLPLLLNLALVAGGAAQAAASSPGPARSSGDRPTATPPAGAPLLDGIAAVTAGMFHTCAITGQGGVLCWGDNFGGQLGDGSKVSHPAPVPVRGLATGVRELAAGSMHTCALTVGGGVLCWGNNGFGQLGAAAPAAESLFPTPVAGLSAGVLALAAGASHTCALTAGGAVYCWGDNEAGQLGDGATQNRSSPVLVTGLAGGVQAITAGVEHTCALLTGGGIKCWGNNAYGQLGDGSGSDHKTPVDVIRLGGAAQQLQAAAYHTCAVVAGAALCWGSNNVGQLGDGTTAGKLAPAPVHAPGGAMLANVLRIAGGETHTCALLAGGSVTCWGDNYYGQLGDNTADDHLLPNPVSTLARGVQAISAGLRHTCAVTAGGGVACWGWDLDGQLGNGHGSDQLAPAPVYGIDTAQALAAGDYHTCAIVAGGAVKCWGWNYHGQLGDATALNRFVPADVYGLAGGVQAIAAGRRHTCALRDDGGVSCWGGNETGQLGDGANSTRYKPVGVQGLHSAAQLLAAGSSHTCAALADGSVQCWGWNTFGQLGDGTVSFSGWPVPVAGLGGAAALSGGYAHSCALLADGSVSCWGWNVYGQDGDGTTDEHLAPVAAQVAPSGVQAIATGSDYTCVVANGAAQCWGNNYLRPAWQRGRGHAAGGADGGGAGKRRAGHQRRPRPRLCLDGERRRQVLGAQHARRPGRRYDRRPSDPRGRRRPHARRPGHQRRREPHLCAAGGRHDPVLGRQRPGPARHRPQPDPCARRRVHHPRPLPARRGRHRRLTPSGKPHPSGKTPTAGRRPLPGRVPRGMTFWRG